MSKHWREKVITKSKSGTIIRYENVSNIINDVNYYALFGSDGMLIEKGTDFNRLNAILYGNMKVGGVGKQ